MAPRLANRTPISDAHQHLGHALRQLRLAASVSMRQVSGFSAGHVSNVEHGYVTPSEAFIEAYVAQFGGGTELGVLYSKMRLASERKRVNQRSKRYVASSTVGAPRELTAATTPDMIARHYTVTCQEATCALGPAGQIETLRVAAEVRALSPVVSLFYAAAFYEADPGRGVLAINATRGMSVLRLEEDDSGAVRAYFRLEQALEADADLTASVEYEIRVASQVRTIPKLLFYARPGMATMSLSATFDCEKPPTRLWRVSGRNVIMASHVPAEELEPTVPNHYMSRFDDLVPGWIYGFSWVW